MAQLGRGHGGGAAGLSGETGQGAAERLAGALETGRLRQQEAGSIRRRPRGVEALQAGKEGADLRIRRDPAVGVQLPQRDVQRPLLPAQVPEAVGRELHALANAHAGEAQEQ